MDRPALSREIADARGALVSTLASLTDENWSAPSLCDGWSVRDVVGHLLHQYDIYRAPYPRWAIVRARFRVNRFLATEARRVAAERSNSELLEQLGRAEYERTRFWGLTPWPQFALTEFVVHAQDIRRPLGVNDSPDVQHLTTAADVFAGRFRRSPLSRVFQPRLPEVRYEATDADWSHGSGPVTRGPLEAIVMVLAGRPVALDDLSGDGVEMLRRRVG